MSKPLEIIIAECSDLTLAKRIHNAIYNAGYVIVKETDSRIPSNIIPQIEGGVFDSKRQGVYDITYTIELQDFSTIKRTIEVGGITVAKAVESGKLSLLEQMPNVKHISASNIKEVGYE